MKRFFIYILILAFALSLGNCKKENFDVITYHNIHGTVKNLCTNKKESGIPVYLVIQTASNTSKIQTASNSSGNFIFNNIPIHSNVDFTYSLYIDTYYTGPYIPLTGTKTVFLDKSNLSKIIQLEYETFFWRFHFVLNSSSAIIYPDTIIITAKQKILMQNDPTYPHGEATFTTRDLPYNSIIQAPPTGWWEITVNKTKSGINTITKDSIYIEPFTSPTITDTIPW